MSCTSTLRPVPTVICSALTILLLLVSTTGVSHAEELRFTMDLTKESVNVVTEGGVRPAKVRSLGQSCACERSHVS